MKVKTDFDCDAVIVGWQGQDMAMTFYESSHPNTLEGRLNRLECTCYLTPSKARLLAYDLLRLAEVTEHESEYDDDEIEI